MKPKISHLCLCLLTCTMLLSSCKKFDGDITVPAYLRLDSITVEKQAANAPSDNAGWYTNDIDAVQLIAYLPGKGKETNLGTFQLPCCIPVLHEGPVDSVRVVPVVKQNGIAQTRIEYPYLNSIVVRGLTLLPEQTTCIGRYDTVNDRYWLPVNYKSPSLIGTLLFDPFEAPATSVAFDTNKVVQWITNDRDHARTGNGYLKVSLPADTEYVRFPIVNSFEVADPTKLLYLEMDYHTDIHLQVGIYSQSIEGNAYSLQWAMTLYPRAEWSKIYINLGRLWSQFNHFHNFQVVFSALNTSNTGGDAYIDNLKIITL